MATVEVGATIEVGATVEVGRLTAAVDAVAKSIAVVAVNVFELLVAASFAAVVVESTVSEVVIVASVAAAGMATVEVGRLTAAVDAIAKSIAAAAVNAFELLVAASTDAVGGGKLSVMSESFVAVAKAEPTAAGNEASELPLPDPRGSSGVREAAVLTLAMSSCGLSGVECDAIVA
jgi:hypothetical protein